MKNKSVDGSGNIVRGTVVIIIAMVIVFGAVFAWMYSMDMLFLPSFIEELIGNDDEPSWDLGALSELVKNGKNENGEMLTFEVSYESLLTALLNSERAEGIYISADINYYSGAEKQTKRVMYYRNGEKFRIEFYGTGRTGAGAFETLEICDGKQLFFLDSLSGESGTVPYNKDILPEEEAGIPSVDALLLALNEFPTSEGVGATPGAMSVTDTSLKLIHTELGNVYYVKFTYSDIGLTEEYYVSLEHRAVISMTSTQNGKTVYSYGVNSISKTAEAYTSGELYNILKATEQ